MLAKLVTLRYRPVSHVQLTTASVIAEKMKLNENLLFFRRKTVGESCFKVLENLSTPLVILGSRREIFSNLQKTSEIFGDLRKSSDTVGKSSETRVLRRCKISTILLKKSWQVYDYTHY